MSETVDAPIGAAPGPGTVEERLRGLDSLVGRTPLLAIDCEYRGARRTLYAKAEMFNMTAA